jgi:circadian clock protein KaiC
MSTSTSRGTATTAAGTDARALPRLETGNPHLDLILGGGFPGNSINIIMGEPGSGKTILAERLVFQNARPGDRSILYLTTLSEPLDKVVRYLQQFSFFDEALLGNPILYDSIGDALVEQGVSMLVPRLKEAITRDKPKIIVIDSFKAIHDLGASLPEMRRTLYAMAGLLTAYETTAFLIGEYGAAEAAHYPEFAIADSIIELARNKTGTRDERYLRILKLRGSAYREGLHAFRVSPDGLEVFPRLVSPQLPPSYRLQVERVSTGVDGLDRMLGGGLPQGRSTFLLGPTGSGKTTLALQFVLEGVRRGEKCLYVNFEENPSQLAQQMASLGANPEELAKKGLQVVYRSPVELQIDSIISEVFRAVSERGVRRAVIDGVGDLLVAASDAQRLHDYLYALAQHFAARDALAIFTYETTQDGGGLWARLSALADNIIRLDVETDGKVRRTIRIVKARGVDHKLDKGEVRITRAGVQVG